MNDGAHPRRARRLSLALALMATCLLTLASTAFAELRRYPSDQEELDQMRASNPQALALLEQGEALAAAGKIQEADGFFQEGLKLYKVTSLFQRRHCQALTVLGPRVEATTACYRALEQRRSNPNVRASVRSWVAGPVAPTMADVGMALDLVTKSMSRAPGQFTPIAALCDVAASLGDGLILRHCATELERLAPQAPDTQRALRLLSTLCPPWRFWVGWIAIAAVTLITLGHAIVKWFRRRPGRMGAGAALVGGLLGLALSMATVNAAAADPAPAPRAKLSTKWDVNDDDPEKSLPPEKDRDKDPLEFGYWLQDVIMRAEVYSNHGKHETAIKLYAALAKAMPDRATAYLKLCDEYEALGDLEHATGACGEALLHDGLVVRDYEHYVRIALAQHGKLSETQTKALSNVLAHLREDPAGRAVVDDVECQVGVRTSNAAQLEECTVNLAKTAATSPQTLTYQWSLAMVRGRLDEARQLIEQARVAGMQPAGLESMEQATESAGKSKRLLRFVFFGIALALAIGAVAVMVVAAMRRRATPGAAT